MRYNLIMYIDYEDGLPPEKLYLKDLGIWRHDQRGLRRFKSIGSAEKFIKGQRRLMERDNLKVDFEIIEEKKEGD